MNGPTMYRVVYGNGRVWEGPAVSRDHAMLRAIACEEYFSFMRKEPFNRAMVDALFESVEAIGPNTKFNGGI